MNQRLSIAHGIIRSFDIFGSSSSLLGRITEVSDVEALRSDWNMVGDDIREAISEFEKKNERDFVKK